MDIRSGRYVSCTSYVDLHPVKMTSPTCEDLGIPTDLGEESGGLYPLLARRVIHNPALHLDGLRYETDPHKVTDPYSPLCMIPLPGSLALHAVTEPSFIRKRNERERERVRCVNEGYERLKEHLPLSNKEKRISKVETLRGAIDYIRQLEDLLADAPPMKKEEHQSEEKTTRTKPHTTVIALDDDDDDVKRSRDNTGTCGGRKRKRRGSLSSEQSILSDSTLSESEDENCLKKQRLHSP